MTATIHAFRPSSSYDATYHAARAKVRDRTVEITPTRDPRRPPLWVSVFAGLMGFGSFMAILAMLWVAHR